MSARPASTADRLGSFLRDLPPLFTDEKPVSFDPVQTSFLQKLVRGKALSASISVKKEDFFKAIVYLDTFAEILAGRPTLLDDVGVIVADLESRHAYLDPDLGLLVRYSAVHVEKDLGGERFFRKATVREVGKRKEISDATPIARPDPVDLFYRAAGWMIADLFATDPVRDAIPRVSTRNDLRLAVVVDAILATHAEPPAADTLAALAAGEWAVAALSALKPFVAAVGARSLAAYVEDAHRKLDGG